MGLVIWVGCRASGIVNMFLDIVSNITQSQKIAFNKGDRLFVQSATVDYLYVVLSGRVKLVRENLEGNSLVIHIAYAGESFAEASLFSDQYHCDCIADNSCELLKFSKKDILEFLNKNPKSMMTLIQNLTSQIRDLRLLSEIKSIYSAKDRIMVFLNSEASEGVFYYTYSLLDLAQKIGLAQETLYRNISILESDGKITRQDGSIKINY